MVVIPGGFADAGEQVLLHKIQFAGEVVEVAPVVQINLNGGGNQCVDAADQQQPEQ